MDLFSDVEGPVLPFVIPNGVEATVEWLDEVKAFLIKIPNGELLYSERFFSKKVSDRSLEYFLETRLCTLTSAELCALDAEAFTKLEFENIDWKQHFISLFGKDVPLPRLTSWHGDQGKEYTYSGISSEPSPWNKGLLYIKEKVEQVGGVEFNSV